MRILVTGGAGFIGSWHTAAIPIFIHKALHNEPSGDFDSGLEQTIRFFTEKLTPKTEGINDA